jgi:hypothetical protein
MRIGEGKENEINLFFLLKTLFQIDVSVSITLCIYLLKQ